MAVFLGAMIIMEHGFTADSVPSLLLCGILVVVGFLGSHIAHEIAEINDQLAGRSKELHAFLRDIKETPRKT